MEGKKKQPFLWCRLPILAALMLCMSALPVYGGTDIQSAEAVEKTAEADEKAKPEKSQPAKAADLADTTSGTTDPEVTGSKDTTSKPEVTGSKDTTSKPEVTEPKEDPEKSEATEPKEDPAGSEVTEPKEDPAGSEVAEPSKDPAGSEVTEPTKDSAGSEVTEPSKDPSESEVTEPTKDPAGSEVTEPSKDPVGSEVTEPSKDPAGSEVTEPSKDPAGSEVTEPSKDPAGSEVTEPTKDLAGSEVTEPSKDPAGSEVTEPTKDPAKTEGTEPNKDSAASTESPTEKSDAPAEAAPTPVTEAPAEQQSAAEKNEAAAPASEATETPAQAPAAAEAPEAAVEAPAAIQQTVAAEAPAAVTEAPAAVQQAQAAPVAQLRAPAPQNFEDDKTVVEINQAGSITLSVNDKQQLEIYNGNDSNKTTYTNSGNITSLKITAGSDIRFNESLTGTYTLNLGKASVVLTGNNVILQPSAIINLMVKDLTINAKNVAGGSSYNLVKNDPSNSTSSDSHSVRLRNMNITAPENVKVYAMNTASASVDSKNASGSGNTLDADLAASLRNQALYIGVKDLSAAVVLEKTNITAADIDLKASNEVNINTTGVGVGMTVNAINTNAKVQVTNSNLNANGSVSNKQGNVTVKAENNIDASSNAESTAGCIAFGVTVLNGTTNTVINGTSTLKANGSILAAADTIAKGSTTVNGIKDKNNESGGYIGITVSNMNTSASIADQASLNAAGDLTVSSDQNVITTTTIKSSFTSAVADTASKKVSSITDSLGISDKILSKIKFKSEDGKTETKLSDLLKADNIKNKLNNAINSALKSEKTDNSDHQFIGGVGVTVANGSNQAIVTTTGTLTAENALQILANAVSNHTTDVDASALSGEGKDAPSKVSSGVAIGVNVVNTENIASVTNATLTANSVKVKADSGHYKDKAGKEWASGSTVTTKSGTNSGDFGVGGAISVNVVNDVTRSELGRNAKVRITNTRKTEKDHEYGNITVEALSDGSASTTADGSVKNGIGAGIAVGVTSQTTIAELNGAASILADAAGKIINDLTVNSKAAGSIEVTAKAGAKGGNATAPAVAVNIVNSSTRSSVPMQAAGGNIIAITGDMTVTAGSGKKKKTSANAKAAGSNVAAGGAISVGVSNFTQTAEMLRSVGSARNIRVQSTGTNSVSNEAIAGANGAKPAKKTASAKADDADAAAGPTADEMADAALASGKKVAEGTDAAAAAPAETPQPAETPEGKIGAAAALALEIWDNRTQAILGGTTSNTGKLTVKAVDQSNIKVNSNASATLSSTGVGVGVSILVGDETNTSQVTGSHNSGSFDILAVMPEKDEPKEGEDPYTTASITVSSLSGAGASDTAVAGSAAINILTTNYLAEVRGILNADDEEAENQVLAVLNQEVNTSAGASSDEDGSGTSTSDKSIGVGASFALTIADAHADAVIRNGSQVATEGDLTVNGVISNEVTTYSEAGSDAYEEPAKKNTVQIFFKNDDGATLDGVKVILTIQNAKGQTIGKPQELKSEKGTVSFLYDPVKNKDYHYVFTIKDTNIKVGDVTYLRPDKDYSVTYIVADEKGLSRTFVLSTEKDDSGKYGSLDASVAVGLVTNSALAVIEKGSKVDCGGDLTLEAESSSSTNAEAKGTSEADNAAVGAAVAVNIVSEDVRAQMSGSAAIGGDFNVKATAQTTDISNAYATASGVDLGRYKDKFNATISDILSGKAFAPSGSGSGSKEPETGVGNKIDAALNKDENGNATDKKTSDDASLSNKVLASQEVQTSETTANTGAASTTGSDAAAADKADSDTTLGDTETKKTNVSVAAAVGTNIVSHNTSALVDGVVVLTGKDQNVVILADNKNNFSVLGTGAAVNKGTSIAAGVAVLVNNSKTTSTLASSIEGSGHLKDLTVESSTGNNVTDGFSTQLGAQALAGAGKGSEEGGAAVAGAVAVIVSHSKTKAEIKNGLVIRADGTISVLALEQSKLAARAWAATLQGGLFDEQAEAAKNPSADPSGKGVGVGAAFGMIYAYNEVTASVGDYTTLQAHEIRVLAEKQRVSASDYNVGDIELNGVIILGADGANSVKVKVNTTDEAQSFDELSYKDLFDKTLELANILASKNYYVEAAGGSAASTGEAVTAAGSFAVLVLNDKVSALIGDHVTLILTGGDVTVQAASDINTGIIAGSLAYGGKVSAGVAVDVVVSNSKVTALAGDYLNMTGAKNVSVLASSKQDLLSILAAAAIAAPTKTGSVSVDGVVSILVDNSRTEAGLGENGFMFGDLNSMDQQQKVTISAVSDRNLFGIVGGASAALSGSGIGASVSVNVLNGTTIAYIDQGFRMTVGKLAVTADSNSKITMIVVNGAAAKDAAVAVSPAVNVIKNHTYAVVGADHRFENGVDVFAPLTRGSELITRGTQILATDNTDILVVSGGAAISLGAVGAGGSVQVDVLNKDVLAMIGDGNANQYNHIYASYGDGLTVAAKGTEKVSLVIVGLAGGNSVAVSGSVGVVVLKNQILAKIGSFTQVGNEYGGANVTVSASDDQSLFLGAGNLSVGLGVTAIGVSNADLISHTRVQALIADDAVIYARNINVLANGKNQYTVIALGGALSGNVSVNGSVAVLVLENKVTANAAGTLNAAGNIVIHAVSNETVDSYAGALSGGSVGIGGAVITVLHKNQTTAAIADYAKVKANAVTVQAESKETLSGMAAAGTAGTIAGGASVVVMITNSETRALIGNGVSMTVNGPVTVLAYDQPKLMTFAGTVSVGGVALGGAVDVMLFRNTVEASVGRYANIHAGSLDVRAVSARNIESYAVGGSLGGTAVSGSVVVILAGKDTSEGDTKKALGTTGNTNSIISRYFADRSCQDMITVSIGDGTVIQTSGSVTIQATESTNLEVISGALAVGGGAGIGGSVAITTLHSTTSANLGNSVVITAGGPVLIKASNTITSGYNKYVSVAGGAGGVVGLGASVVYINTEGTVQVVLNNAAITSNGNINAEAVLTESVYPKALGGALSAGVSAGVSVAKVTVTGNVKTLVNGCHITSNNGNVTILAAQDISAQVYCVAASGGVAAGLQGSAAILTVNAVTNAGVSGNVFYVPNGTILIEAKLLADGASTAEGVAGSFCASGGVSAATVTVKPSVTAAFNNNQVTGKNVTVLALFNRDEAGNRVRGSYSAHAYAGGVALGGSLNGALAVVDLGGLVNAQSLSNNMNLTGNLLVQADSFEYLYGEAEGLSIAGLLAVGGAETDLTNRLSVNALLSGTIHADSISLLAKGQDLLSGVSKGTSGGLLLVGTAQGVYLTDGVNIYTSLGSGSYYTTKDFTMLASGTHTINGIATGASYAGFAAGGMSVIRTDAATNTTTTIGENALISSGRNINIQAVDQMSRNTNAHASAGAFLGSANDVKDTGTVNKTTQVLINKGSELNSKKHITINAESGYNHIGLASAYANGLIAAGLVKEEQSVSDRTYVLLQACDITSEAGDITITAKTTDHTDSLRTETGKGISGITVDSGTAKLNNTTDAVIKLQEIGNDHVYIDALTGNVTIKAVTDNEAHVVTDLNNGVFLGGYMALESNINMTVRPEIYLGTGNSVDGLQDVVIQAMLSKLIADSHSTAISSVNFASGMTPDSIVNVGFSPLIQGTNAELAAGRDLKVMLYGDSNAVKFTSVSYAYNPGVWVDVTPDVGNDVNMHGSLILKGSGTTLSGSNVRVAIELPTKNSTNFVLSSTYKSWVSHDQTHKAHGDLVSAGQNMTLDGTIYYGQLLGTTIVIDEDGKLNGSSELEVKYIPGTLTYQIVSIKDVDYIDYYYDYANHRIVITNWKVQPHGSLSIEAPHGVLLGDVTAYSSNRLNAATLINHSDWDVVIGRIEMPSGTRKDTVTIKKGVASILYDKFAIHYKNDTNSFLLFYATEGTDVIVQDSFNPDGKDLGIAFVGDSGNIYAESTSNYMEVNSFIVLNGQNVGTDAIRLNVRLLDGAADCPLRPEEKVLLNAHGKIRINWVGRPTWSTDRDDDEGMNWYDQDVYYVTDRVGGIIAENGYWQKCPDGSWKYIYGDQQARDGWYQIDGKWYCFNENGYLVLGWANVKGNWLFFEKEDPKQAGTLVTGLMFDPAYNAYFYLSPDNGVMQTGWVEVNGEKKYFYEDTAFGHVKGQMKQPGDQEPVQTSGPRYRIFDPITGTWRTPTI